MKTLVSSVIASLILVTTWVTANPVANEEYVNNGGLESLRGSSELSDTKQAELIKKPIQNDQVIDRNYVHQPPLIPHDIRGYQVDIKSNKCLSCHGWKFASQVGATKVSPTHFETADGLTLSDVAPRRYFCLQCHVPQADAPPLIANDFSAVEALSASGLSN